MRNLIIISLIIFHFYLAKAQDSVNHIHQEQEKFVISHGPYLQYLGESSVTFVWTTNKEAISWVELAPDDSTHFYFQERPKYFASSYGLKNVSTIHTVHVEHLKPGTKYRYRVFSREVLGRNGDDIYYGDIASTIVYKQTPPTFRTNNKTKETISFLMLNDIHERNQIMENLLKDTDWDKTDLVFFNGDMVNNMQSEAQMFEGFMDTAVKQFASEIPMYYARGNHETRGNFADRFYDYFPSPTGNLYYMFRQGPASFIVLDGGEDKPDTDIEYSNITTFDNYRTEQALWLKEAIKSEEFQNSLFKIVVMHMPPFGGWHGEKDIAEKFLPILNDAHIDVILCGHLHRNIYQKPKEGVYNAPIIVNSNNSILKANIEEKEMKIQITDLEGKIVDSFLINKNEFIQL